MKNKVVITGMGAITPLGNSVSEFFDRLISGETGVGPITRFDTSRCPVKNGGEIKDFDADSLGLAPRDIRIMERFQHFAIAAAEQAIAQAGLDLPRNPVRQSGRACARRDRYGAAIGVACSSMAMVEPQVAAMQAQGTRAVSPFLFNAILPNVGTSAIAIRFGLTGPSLTASGASGSGSEAIIAAYDQIAYGRADVMVAGGAESAVSELIVSGFSQNHTGSRQGVCRPFDRDRDGTVCSEGAAVLVLESLDHAQARGAQILGEIAGYSLRADAFDMSDIPPADAPGLCSAIRDALEFSGMNPDEVAYINVHGTGTKNNDPAEAHAINTVFGTRAKEIFVSGIKGATGHMLGGSGALECLTTVLACRLGRVPPTYGLRNPDPACDLRHVIGKGVDAHVPAALTTSVGMGGNNSVIAVRGPESFL